MIKKTIFVSVLLAMISCVATPDRKVADNVLTSSYPAIKIKVNPLYTLVASKSENYLSDHPSGVKTMSTDWNYFNFAIVDNLFGMRKKTVFKRALSIEFNESDVPWTTDSFYYEDRLFKEELTLSGRKFQCYAEVSKGSRLAKDFPPYVMVMKAFHINQPSKMNLIRIRYFEDLKLSGYPPQAWANKDMLSPAQLEYVQGFKNRFLKSFSIIE